MYLVEIKSVIFLSFCEIVACNKQLLAKQEEEQEERGSCQTLQATKKRDKEGGKRHERPLVKLFQIVRQCNP